MWTEVDSAQAEVKWQTYICKDDCVGNMTVAKLEDAHRRGVQTELLYDCGGNISGRSRLTDKLRHSGASVIRHRPFFQFLWSYFASGMNWQKSPAIRNHRKILVVDKRVGFAGGLNIGDDYCGMRLGGNGRFRDSHCRVTGPAVSHLLEVYEDTKQPKEWRFSLSRWRHILQGYLLRHRRRVESRQVYQQGKTVVQRLQNLREAVIAQYAHHHQLGVRYPSVRYMKQRLQALRRQKRSAPLSEGEELKSKSPSSAFRIKLQLWKANAAKKMTQRDERRKQRRETVALRNTPLDDASPVPESVFIHSHMAPFTQVLMSNPHTRDWSIQLALWQITRKAHRRVWITTPYYMPHRKLTKAILQAARSGVDVRIMSGSRHTTDPWFMWYASQYLSAMFLSAGVRIYEFHGGQIMHAKTVVVDSVWSCVGSYNFDAMSNKNMEVCVTHFGTDVARELESHFLVDMTASNELKLSDLQSRSAITKMISFVAYNGLRLLEKLTFLTYNDADLQSR